MSETWAAIRGGNAGGPVEAPHCPSCTCGRRAPVQGDRRRGVGPGSIAWAEHLTVWSAYAARHGSQQSAERMADRGGFGYGEIVDLLGRHPETWVPGVAR